MTDQYIKLSEAIALVEKSGLPQLSVDELRALPTYPAPDRDAIRAEALREAYRLGFEASSEMWNGEFPFRGEPVEANAEWIAGRDRALASLGGGE